MPLVRLFETKNFSRIDFAATGSYLMILMPGAYPDPINITPPPELNRLIARLETGLIPMPKVVTNIILPEKGNSFTIGTNALLLDLVGEPDSEIDMPEGEIDFSITATCEIVAEE